MPDYINRAEFEAFKATLVSRGEINGLERRVDESEKSLKETRKLHFDLKEDVRDWQANDQTEGELLKASLRPLFREDDEGITFITKLLGYPKTKQRTDRLWLIFKIICGIGTAVSALVGILSAIM